MYGSLSSYTFAHLFSHCSVSWGSVMRSKMLHFATQSCTPGFCSFCQQWVRGIRCRLTKLLMPISKLFCGVTRRFWLAWGSWTTPCLWVSTATPTDWSLVSLTLYVRYPCSPVLVRCCACLLVCCLGCVCLSLPAAANQDLHNLRCMFDTVILQAERLTGMSLLCTS